MGLKEWEIRLATRDKKVPPSSSLKGQEMLDMDRILHEMSDFLISQFFCTGFFPFILCYK